jgi:hypothetical protein
MGIILILPVTTCSLDSQSPQLEFPQSHLPSRLCGKQSFVLQNN